MSLYDIAIARKLSSGGGSTPSGSMEVRSNLTLDNAFNSDDFSTLRTMIGSNNASVMVEGDATALGFGQVFAYCTAADGGICMTGSDSIGNAFYILWEDKALMDFTIFLADGNYVDGKPYASLVPATVTIIYHPLN